MRLVELFFKIIYEYINILFINMNNKKSLKECSGEIPVALQLAYIQSIPLAPIKGYKLCVASSTVSLNASDGECPGH